MRIKNQESRIAPSPKLWSVGDKNRSVAKAMERRRQESRIKHKKLYSLFVTIQELSKKLSFRMISEVFDSEGRALRAQTRRESSNLINNPNLEDCHVGRRLPPRNDRLLLNSELLPSFLPLNSRAFTLVEILVVMAILSVFGTLIVTIFSRTLTGSNKSQIIGAIKQNGQAVLEIIDKTIRNADKVICVSLDKNSLITVKEGIYTRFRFIPPFPAANPTANGFIQQDNPVRQIDPNTGQNETDPVFESRICANGDAMNSPIIITDTNPQSGASVNCVAAGGIPDCSTNPIFEKVSAAGFMDQVTIKFDLRPGLNAPKSVAGQIDPVTFQTTIQLR